MKSNLLLWSTLSFLTIGTTAFLLNTFAVINLSSYQESLFRACLVAAQGCGVVYLFNKSTIKKTVYWKIISGLLAVHIIGVLFKLMHWSGQGILLSISTLGIPIVYFARFLMKESKDLIGLLKVIWVVSVGILMYFSLISKTLSKEYMNIQIPMFWILFFVYLFYQSCNSQR